MPFRCTVCNSSLPWAHNWRELFSEDRSPLVIFAVASLRAWKRLSARTQHNHLYIENIAINSSSSFTFSVDRRAAAIRFQRGLTRPINGVLWLASHAVSVDDEPRGGTSIEAATDELTATTDATHGGCTVADDTNHDALPKCQRWRTRAWE
jgi:hypothetical protein